MQTKRLTFNEYPLLLRQIHHPPKFLDISGAPIPSDDYKFLCVVGARDFTQYGADTCRHLVAGLKGYPVVIVSGLAIGIDSIAHEVAMENEIRTISFPGSGLKESSIYPPSHLNLAKRIIGSGNTLVSAFEPEQESTLWTFPSRNRIMAGISHATLIIEGRVGSGTLITAEHALGFNRDVLIVPGSIFSETSYAPHLLYKQGAIPVTSSREILVELGLAEPEPPIIKIKKKRPWYKGRSDVKSSNRLNLGSTTKKGPDAQIHQIENTKKEAINLSHEERAIIEALAFAPLSTTTLIEKTSLSPVKLNVLLSKLELQDLIKKDGEKFRVCGKVNR
jgi:DNA protecting protein DprA